MCLAALAESCAMSFRLVFPAATSAALLLIAGAAAAQSPASEPDPYTLPPGYDQVTGYDGAPEDSPRYDEPASSADAYGGPDQGGSYDQGRAQTSSSYSRGYVRGGESYSSRERQTSQEAYVEGTARVDEQGVRVEQQQGYVVGATSASQTGYSSRYDSRSGGVGQHDYVEQGEYQSYGAEAARFGYQRRFYAFSVAEARTESTTVVTDDFGYTRRYEPRPFPWRNDDLHLDGASQLALTGGVEGGAYVAASSGGGGYATVSASASAGARAGAFAGVRGGRGRPGSHHSCGCRH